MAYELGSTLVQHRLITWPTSKILHLIAQEHHRLINRDDILITCTCPGIFLEIFKGGGEID